MTVAYPKRLIEVDLPIKRISAHARREKSIRHGHISTLHIWWARRPLAACRAVICAALWPDPADPLCPQRFRDDAARLITEFARKIDVDLGLLRFVSEENKPRWSVLAKGDQPLDPTDANHQNTLRHLLLDFIADFANWDNSTVPLYLATSRALTQSAHESLGGSPGTRPLVVDPFAGGGSIPLEALRVGADAFASDLNPVAVLLNKVVLEYIPKYGQRLADEVRKWGAWIKEQAEKELAEFYPKDPDGATPIAYLWARTILSEAPSEGDLPVELPLMRSLWLAKRSKWNRALRWVRDQRGVVRTEKLEVKYADGTIRLIRRPLLEIFEPKKESEVERGTVSQGSATCPVTGYTTPVTSVRRQLKERRGGSTDSRLYAVVTLRPGQQGRHYRSPDKLDIRSLEKADSELEMRKQKRRGEIPYLPNEKFTGAEPRRIPLPLYGATGFSDMFTSRQLLAIATLGRLTHDVPFEKNSQATDLQVAIKTALALCTDKVTDLSNTCCRWEPIAQCPRQLFARQAIPMVWDFAEGIPTGQSSGSYDVMIDRFCHILEQVGSDWRVGHVEKASATTHSLPDDSAQAIVTDPPYYYSVPYSDLSDFFYVWLRRSIGELHPDLFDTQLTPKDQECVQNLPHSAVAHLQKSREFYEQQMQAALAEARRIARPDAIGTVVFAHSETEAWETLLAALIAAGWQVTASWPIDTEMSTRVLAQRQSTLASSVHLVCRPRENPDGSLITDNVGDWRDVLSELPRRIHDWLPRLADEGVVGADAIFACLGPALEIFSRYSRVEKASGEVVPLREYLEQVWAAVSNEALSLVFRDADASGLEPDARLTAMWLWTLSTNATDKTANDGDGDEPDDEDAPAKPSAAKGGFSLEFDAARKIAQGLGANLEALPSIVEVKGQTARLLPVSERARHLFGKDADAPPPPKPKKRKPSMLPGMEDVAVPDPATLSWDELGPPRAGTTVLDRVHQAMLLFGTGRSEALKRFVVEEGAGADPRFWKLAQSFSALYPPGTEEKRWVDGVLARKKGLGF